MKKKELEEKVENMSSCLLSILDSLKLYDMDSLDTSDENLSMIMFRKMRAYNIDLNKELGFTHLKPVPFSKKESTLKILERLKRYADLSSDLSGNTSLYKMIVSEIEKLK